jgi:hypothetical protein
MDGTTQERPRMVAKQSGELETAVRVLGERIEELRVNLTPVCRERGPEVAPDNPQPEPPMSQHAIELRNRCCEIQCQTAIVADTLDRLDL